MYAAILFASNDAGMIVAIGSDRIDCMSSKNAPAHLGLVWFAIGIYLLLTTANKSHAMLQTNLTTPFISLSNDPAVLQVISYPVSDTASSWVSGGIVCFVTTKAVLSDATICIIWNTTLYGAAATTA